MKKTVFSPNNYHVTLVALRPVAGRGRAPILSLPIIALTLLLMAWTSRGQSVVFSDCFTNGSTVNSTNPAVPADIMITYADTNSEDGTNYYTSDSTSYEMISAGTWSPAPSITRSNLDFGEAASSFHKSIEVQALFSTTPVALARSNDYIQLTVTFTDKKGILTNSAGASNYFCLGLFNSGTAFNEGDTNFIGITNFPVAGGLNGTAQDSYSNAVTGRAQNWVGYSDQIANTGVKSRINTRVAQTGSGNNNQDVLTGSQLTGSQGYGNPGPNISYSSANSTVVLTNGRQYTAVLTLTATAATTNDDILSAISNSVSLYAGVGTNGALRAQFGATLTGTNYTTNSFDALAIGWYEASTNVATEIDINQITVTAYQQSDIANLYLGNVDDVDSNLVFIADCDNNVVYAYVDDGSGTNTIAGIVAGNGTAGYSGDGGNPTNASLNHPTAVYMDSSGNVFIADTGNNVVRMVWTTNNSIWTIAGNGVAGYSGDGGPPQSASLNSPSGVYVNYYGTLYIADASNNVVRMVPFGGNITTVAGNGIAGYSGDGGSATNASVSFPIGGVLDDFGNFSIYDPVNNAIRGVDTNGTISTTVTGAAQ